MSFEASVNAQRAFPVDLAAIEQLATIARQVEHRVFGVKGPDMRNSKVTADAARFNFDEADVGQGLIIVYAYGELVDSEDGLHQAICITHVLPNYPVFPNYHGDLWTKM